MPMHAVKMNYRSILISNVIIGLRRINIWLSNPNIVDAMFDYVEVHGEHHELAD
jgi:hypothetical protein